MEALNGPYAPQHPGPTVTLTSESHSMEQVLSQFDPRTLMAITSYLQETKKSKKSRRRGSREQRDKDRAEVLSPSKLELVWFSR